MMSCSAFRFTTDSHSEYTAPEYEDILVLDVQYGYKHQNNYWSGLPMSTPGLQRINPNWEYKNEGEPLCDNFIHKS